MGSLDPPGAAGDRELWLRAGDGDAAAFGELFSRHASAVYNHLFRRVADWSEAEDLTSAVFLQAWRRQRGRRPGPRLVGRRLHPRQEPLRHRR